MAFWDQILFTYEVKNAFGLTSNVASVLLDVNDPPVAANDSVTTAEEIAIDIDVKLNDIDGK